MNRIKFFALIMLMAVFLIPARQAMADEVDELTGEVEYKVLQVDYREGNIADLDSFLLDIAAQISSGTITTELATPYVENAERQISDAEAEITAIEADIAALTIQIFALGIDINNGVWTPDTVQPISFIPPLVPGGDHFGTFYESTFEYDQHVIDLVQAGIYQEQADAIEVLMVAEQVDLANDEAFLAGLLGMIEDGTYPESMLAPYIEETNAAIAEHQGIIAGYDLDIALLNIQILGLIVPIPNPVNPEDEVLLADPWTFYSEYLYSDPAGVSDVYLPLGLFATSGTHEISDVVIEADEDFVLDIRFVMPDPMVEFEPGQPWLPRAGDSVLISGGTISDEEDPFLVQTGNTGFEIFLARDSRVFYRGSRPDEFPAIGYSLVTQNAMFKGIHTLKLSRTNGVITTLVDDVPQETGLIINYPYKMSFSSLGCRYDGTLRHQPGLFTAGLVVDGVNYFYFDYSDAR